MMMTMEEQSGGEGRGSAPAICSRKAATGWARLVSTSCCLCRCAGQRRVSV